MVAQMESQKTNFQLVLDSVCAEYYMNSYNQAKAGGSLEVGEEDSSEEDAIGSS